MEMRNAMAEVDDAGGLKGRQRGKMKPKMGRLDIDYQKLHDAFFRFQTKPKLSRFGDMYGFFYLDCTHSRDSFFFM